MPSFVRQGGEDVGDGQKSGTEKREGWGSVDVGRWRRHTAGAKKPGEQANQRRRHGNLQ
jgi:hypothetical protein